ncbi:MAG: YIP1 family protein [Candidatus Saelkia tenebricola]|nr:YIP1 family protein [Candidatus Saelkia tenebricola]
MNVLFQRMIRAAKLDVNLYEEVEHDKSSLNQAMIVVVLSSIAAGIGAMSIRDNINLIAVVIAALIGWAIWAFLIYLIGVKLLPTSETKSDVGELMRTIGFASSPGVIRILGIIPGLFYAVSFIAQIWMLITMVIAVRQALDYKSTGRAILVCIFGWFIQAALLTFLLR